LKKENLRIGTKIKVNFIIQKVSCDKTGKRERIKSICKTGYIIGLRKKLTEWKIIADSTVLFGYKTIPVKSDYIIEFKKRLSGKIYEAFLSDVELYKGENL
jgi:hypothetical protein